MVAKTQIWSHPMMGDLTEIAVMKPHVNEEIKLICSLNTFRHQPYNSNSNSNSISNGILSSSGSGLRLGLGLGLGLGLVRVWNQIQAERKTKYVQRTEGDYLIKGKPNQVFRWCLTAVIVVALVFRVFNYHPGYCWIIYASWWLCVNRLLSHLSITTLYVWEASDWARFVDVAPNGQITRYEPCITTFFRHKLSPDHFYSLVRRIYEFKFWYRTTRDVVLTFGLTWFPFLEYSFFGEQAMLFWIFVQGCQLVYTIMTRSGKKKPTIRYFTYLE